MEFCIRTEDTVKRFFLRRWGPISYPCKHGAWLGAHRGGGSLTSPTHLQHFFMQTSSIPIPRQQLGLPSMSLLHLSNEILHQIFSNSDILSPGDVFNILVTCRRLSETGLPSLYQTLLFKNPRDLPLIANPKTRLSLYIKSLLLYPEGVPQRLSWTRSAEFEWYHNNFAMWNQVHDLLPRLKNLDTISLHSSTDRDGLAAKGYWGGMDSR